MSNLLDLAPVAAGRPATRRPRRDDQHDARSQEAQPGADPVISGAAAPWEEASAEQSTKTVHGSLRLPALSTMLYSTATK